MAVIGTRGGISGSIDGTILFGRDITFQPREGGVTIAKSKPHPNWAQGLKDAENVEEFIKERGIAGKPEKVKKVKEKQERMDDALEYCRKLKKEDPVKFNRKFKTGKPLVSPFNHCVGLYLKGGEDKVDAVWKD